MKKINFSIAAIAAILTLGFTSCTNSAAPAAAGTEESAQATKGAIVYFNVDKVINEYDMANDLRSVVENKVNSISQEVNRRGTKLQNDVNAFQEKIDKGLLTRSVAEAQSTKLQQQQNEFQQYAAQKEQEVAEEQNVMMNQILNAIKEFVDQYTAEKGFAMVLATQGDILPAPVVAADPSLDITEAVLAGLNEEYIKTKNANK